MRDLKRKFIQDLERLHRESEDENLLPDNGLCCCVAFKVNQEIGRLFTHIMSPEDKIGGHWGIGDDVLILSYFEKCYAYTPLRKNLLLLFIEYLKTDYHDIMQ